MARRSYGVAPSNAKDLVTKEYADTLQGLPVGAVMLFDGKTAPSGWLISNGGTIGSASSGATLRANADVEALFTHLWTQYDNTELVIQTSAGAGTTRGASAAADFAANKRMPTHDYRDEFPRFSGASRVPGTKQEGTWVYDNFGNNATVVVTPLTLEGTMHSDGAVSLTTRTWNQTTPLGSPGSSELAAQRVRPRNIALLGIIKYANAAELIARAIDEVIHNSSDTYTISASSPSMISMSRSGANQVKLPTLANAAGLVLRKPYLINQLGAGATTISADTGATLRLRSGLTGILGGQYAAATAMLVDATTWWVYGDLVAT